MSELSTVTIISTGQKIKKMKNHYQNDLKETPAYAIFQAKIPYVVITAYQSGKVVFQGNLAQEEAMKWDKNINSLTKMPTVNFLNDSHIGSDESGTGDYFGPITTSAVFVPKDKIPLLKEIGIQDSKKLTDQKIMELTNYIVAMNLPYSSVILDNLKYNALQKQGWSQGKMKAMLHQSAINNVVKQVDNRTLKGILIDQFCLPEIYKKHISSEQLTLQANTHFMTKAETYSIAVATASIIARARFVQEMNRLSEQVNMDLLKGASQKVDQQIARIIKQYGRKKLNEIAKIHFANTQKAEKWL